MLKDGIQNTYGEGRNYGRERTLREDQAKRYKVIFLGPAQNDTDHVNKLTESLKDRFKLSTDAITKLMKSAPVSVKKELSLSEAERYKEALEAIGAKISLEPMKGVEEQSQREKESTPQQSQPRPPIIPLRKGTTPYTATSVQADQEVIQCPQCGYVQAKTDECIKCGVIISKLLKHRGEGKVLEEKVVSSDIIGTPSDEYESYTPWEDMSNLGFFIAFFRTIKEVLFSPSLFFRKMPVDMGILNPLFFGVIIGFVGGLFTLWWQYAFSGLIGAINLFFTSSILFYAFFLPFLIALGLFVASGIFHILLMLVGGNKRGFEATFRVVAYSNSTQVFSVLPVLGGLIAIIYNLILWTIGFRESHQISTAKAAFVVFLPLIIVTVLILMAIFMFLLPFISSQTQIFMQPPPRF